VVSISDQACMIDGVIVEEQGVVYCKTVWGANTKWVRTFKDQSARKHYAGTGYIYDRQRDAFIRPKPFNSWTLNETTCEWDPPVPVPDDAHEVFYDWNEDTQSWDIIT